MFSIFLQNNFLNNEDVYYFLERLEVKGLIELNHHQKPYSRQLIAEKLEELEKKREKLSETEKADLDYYLRQYSSHIDQAKEKETTFLGKDNSGIYQFFSYKDSLLNLNLQFDGGLGYVFRKDEIPSFEYWNGLSSFGSIGSNFSYDLKFNDISITNYSKFTSIDFSGKKRNSVCGRQEGNKFF